MALQKKQQKLRILQFLLLLFSVSIDYPILIHRNMNETYTLIETRPADGYALASKIEFRLVPKTDENGEALNEVDV